MVGATLLGSGKLDENEISSDKKCSFCDEVATGIIKVQKDEQMRTFHVCDEHYNRTVADPSELDNFPSKPRL